MPIEKACAYLKALSPKDRIIELEQSNATVELAAQAVGCEPARIDNSKFKNCSRTKAETLSADEAEQLIGHGISVICPFDADDRCVICLDEPLHRIEVVYPAAVVLASTVRLTISEIEQAYAHC